MDLDAVPIARQQLTGQWTPDGGRLIRLLTRFIGLGFLAYLLVSLPEIARDHRIVAAWWTPVAVCVIFGPGLALVATSFRGDRRHATAVAASAVAGYLVVNVLWLVAWTGGHVDGPRGAWPVMFSGLAGLCAALFMRPVWAFAVQFIASFLSSLANQLGLDLASPLATRVAYETVWAVAFSAVFVAAALVTVRTADLLDATREHVERRATSAAARDARDSERARYDALVHDRVLATLLEAYRTPEDPRIREHAREALRELDLLAHKLDVEEAVGFDTLVRRLCRLCAEHALTPTVSTDDAVAACRYPAHVVGEMLAATAEALRNSVRHAGRDAQRHVSARVGTDALGIFVTDSGPGFDYDSRSSGRLGIDLSITRRMERLRGGRSTVVSSVDAGTTVELEWHR